jgi:16S rRNA (guanine(966)-N(2))-methyltransferase RsmD
MRVIAGLYRSRLLSSPPGTTTRPTSDRLRETLFNILAPRLEGCRFVDLYAGTGAVGIEALSRGAAWVFFAENAAPALKSLRANLTSLKISGKYSLEDRGVPQLLQKLSPPIDVIYLDPPYEDEAAYTQTLGYLGSAGAQRILTAESLIVVEHATRAKFKLSERYGSLMQTRTYKQGDASLAFYAPRPAEDC